MWACPQLSLAFPSEPLTLDALLPGWPVQVSLSVLEVYNERIRDLLCPANDNLAVVADPLRGIQAAGATQLPVRGEGECMRVALAGLSQRAVASTAMNAASSRSHCIVTLSVDRLYPDGGLKCSKLCLVDLAGSERSSRTKAEGALLAEGSQINKSLSALGNVVNALSEGGAKTHIPYRSGGGACCAPPACLPAPDKGCNKKGSPGCSPCPLQGLQAHPAPAGQPGRQRADGAHPLLLPRHARRRRDRLHAALWGEGAGHPQRPGGHRGQAQHRAALAPAAGGAGEDTTLPALAA